MKCFLPILLFVFDVYSQNTEKLTDKRYTILQEKVRLETANNLDSAFYYCSKIEMSNVNLHKVWAKSYKAYLFQLKGDTINSNLLIRDANLILIKTKETQEKKKIETHVYNLEGLITKKRGKYNEALEKFEKGKLISSKENDLTQIYRFNNNISSIYAGIGNYQIAIQSLKENSILLDKIGVLFSKDEFMMNKSNINYNIANFYENLYLKKSNIKYLDSAINYLNKTIRYSDNLINYKLRAIMDLGTLSKIKGDHVAAEKYYNSAEIIIKDNNFIYESIVVKYNLGDLYFSEKKYQKALFYFQKVDSIALKNNLKNEEFIRSNYFQAKIYNILNENDKSVLYADTYLVEFEKTNDKLFAETININNKLSNKEIKVELENIKANAENSKNRTFFLKLLLAALFLVLIFYLIKVTLDKKKANLKVDELLKKFKTTEGNNQQIKISQAFSIDDEKEREILERLMVLEEKEYFLDMSFNQQNVAKKIKTNTSYLSSVVNKNFGKTFSEYSNELKINYAIQELINNPVYRKYSTQAIAESVGYKNANSFTISFKKRAGMTPAQFILNLQKRL